MQSTVQMRVSIKPYLQDYIQQKADELGITDHSEVVNLLILDHKRGLISNPSQQFHPAPAAAPGELEELSALIEMQ